MNNKHAFESLFKTSYTSLYFYAFHFINDIEASKDIVSDAFRYVWEHCGEMDPEAVKGYLYVSVRNKCLNYLRHQHVHAQYIEFCRQVSEDSVETEYRETGERTMRLRKALDTLSPRTRQILEECYVHKKKYREVAHEQAISISAVRKHIMKALRTIRAEFAKNN
ncbi:MAG: RNA polymerase sigma-70 factor [Proteiniphilum sp.]|jgi:RNA polymerase sigma-70 factor (ECF subfamily)|nr:RNA polymerase sigma-70 factor [Proteiniphilum sp.]